MADEIKKTLGIEAELQASSGGRFEVTADGELIFSKIKEGRFPEHREIIVALMHKLPQPGG